MSIDSRICCSCVQDAYLRQEVARQMQSIAECDYCENAGPTIGLRELAQRCSDVIQAFYELSSMTAAVVFFGQTPRGDELIGLLQKLTGVEGAALSDLHGAVTDQWFDRDSLEQKYGDDDPWFVESSDNAENLNAEWEKMERSLRETARLFNPSALALLEMVFGPVTSDRSHDGHSVVIKVGPGHPIDSFVRARDFETLQDLKFALEHPEARLGPPPVGVGDGGRMNSAGIPAFYGATKASTAIAEVRPAVGANVAVATFKIIRELNLLDLSRLGAISISSVSKFDPATVERAIRKNFLANLVRKLAMPVLPGRAKADYVITQAIADFLATHPKLNLDGILFLSTQEGAEDPHARNVVLFRKACTVLRAGDEWAEIGSSYLYEYEDGAEWYAPTIESAPAIQVNHEQHNKRLEPQWFKPALELDRDQITVHQIRSVKYAEQTIKVAHVRKDG